MLIQNILFLCLCFRFFLKQNKNHSLLKNATKTLIVGHRGLIKEHLENTQKSLEAALKKVDGIEFDVQLTKDLKPFVFHDRYLLRLTGINKNIDEIDSHEMEKILQHAPQYKENYPITSLEKILEACPKNKLINIELKETCNNFNGLNYILSTIKPYQKTHNIIISSFECEILDKVYSLDSNYALGLLIDKNFTFSDYKAYINILSKISFIHPHISLVNCISSKIIRLLNLRLIFWGHKKLGDEKYLIKDAHSAIISDVALELAGLSINCED